MEFEVQWLQVDNNECNAAMDYNYIGVQLSEAGRWEEAISEFDASIRLDPKSAATYDNRGVAYSYLYMIFAGSSWMMGPMMAVHLGCLKRRPYFGQASRVPTSASVPIRKPLTLLPRWVNLGGRREALQNRK